MNFAARCFLAQSRDHYQRRQQPPPRRFQGRGRRIETMWSEEHQSWCSWSSESQDYVVDQELNRVAQPASNERNTNTRAR